MQERKSKEDGVGFELGEISTIGIKKATPNPKIRRLNLILNIFQ
jgi:hypothetical protein